MTMLNETESGKIKNDALEMEKLLREISQGARSAKTCVEDIIDFVKTKPESEGISFLDIKNRLLASYSSNLGLLMLRKCHGKELEGETAIDRMVEIRTVLEKVRPIDQKLRYQIDKLVNIAESGTIDKNDPLRFKPNPSGLVSKLEENDAEKESKNDKEDGGKKRKEGKYKPSRNVPQFFQDDKDGDNEVVQEEKKKKHRLSRSIMDSIKEQYLDVPEEISNWSGTIKKKKIDEDLEKARFEEENFIRFRENKKEKDKNRNVFETTTTIGDEVVSFGRNVYDENGGGDSRGKKRKLGGKSGGKSKGKGSKKSNKFKKRM